MDVPFSNKFLMPCCVGCSTDDDYDDFGQKKKWPKIIFLGTINEIPASGRGMVRGKMLHFVAFFVHFDKLIRPHPGPLCPSPPPSFGTFPKIHPFLKIRPSFTKWFINQSIVYLHCRSTAISYLKQPSCHMIFEAAWSYHIWSSPVFAGVLPCHISSSPVAIWYLKRTGWNIILFAGGLSYHI